MRAIVVVLAFLLHGMSGCMWGDEEPVADPTGTTGSSAAPLKAVAELRKINKTGPEGAIVGWANFTDVGGQLTVVVSIVGGGLNATQHGVHVHSNGDCGGDGTTAGSKASGHLNPDNATHGGHAGDLGNIATDVDGKGQRTVMPSEFRAPLTLVSGSKYLVLGRSVVVHADPDDGVTNPAGKSGTRVLCGVIAAS